MRHFRMFALTDDASQPYFTVSGIHDEQGYRTVRDAFARSRDISISEPDIQVVDVDLLGDRVLRLQHIRRNEVPLDETTRDATLVHLRHLWGYEVVIDEVAAAG